MGSKGRRAIVSSSASGVTVSESSGSEAAKPSEETSLHCSADFEKIYAYVGPLKEMMRHAMILTGDERTKMIFTVLKRLEHYMGSEVTKLKRRPNRATRYARGIRRLTAMTKLAMAYLPEESDAYPTLGMILVHYLDIVLDSSWNDRQSTKTVAASTNGFLKFMFDDDVEYVLDVVLTSIANIAAAEKDSIAYFMLLNIVRDIYFYCNKKATLAKYCAIAHVFAKLEPAEVGEELVSKAVQTCSRIPAEFQSYLEETYKFPRVERFSLKTAIEIIDYRSVANSSRHRLVIVSSKRKRMKMAMNKTEISSASSSGNTDDNQGSTCFFRDTFGSRSDEIAAIDFSSLRDVSEDEDEDGDEFASNEAFPNPDLVVSSDNEGSSLPSIQSDLDSGNDDVDETHVENNIENENKDEDVSDTENFADKLIQFDDMYDRRDLFSSISLPEPMPAPLAPARPTLPSIETPTLPPNPKPVEDSDIEVLMEDIVEHPGEDENDPFDGEGEKDEADPESGESDVPVYTSAYIMKPRAYASSDEEEEKSTTKNKKTKKPSLPEVGKDNQLTQVTQGIDSISSEDALPKAYTEKIKAGLAKSSANKKDPKKDNIEETASLSSEETTKNESDSRPRRLEDAYVSLKQLQLDARTKEPKAGKVLSPKKGFTKKAEISAEAEELKANGHISEKGELTSQQSTNESDPKISSPSRSKRPSSDVVGELQQIPLRGLRKRTSSTASSVDTNSSVRRSSRLASKDPTVETKNEVEILLANLDSTDSPSRLSSRKRESRSSVAASSNTTVSVEKKPVKSSKPEPAKSVPQPKRQKKSVQEEKSIDAEPRVTRARRGRPPNPKVDSLSLSSPSKTRFGRSRSSSATVTPPRSSRSSKMGHV